MSQYLCFLFRHFHVNFFGLLKQQFFLSQDHSFYANLITPFLHSILPLRQLQLLLKNFDEFQLALANVAAPIIEGSIQGLFCLLQSVIVFQFPLSFQ